MKQLLGALSGFAAISLLCSQDTLRPLQDEAEAPELASLMGELQRYTHKLALSAEAGNAELAAFYLHESQEQLRKIQKEAPDYEQLPIALLVERLALPAYQPMQEAVTAKDKAQMRQAAEGIIQACNTCHTATQRSFIRITSGSDKNPFNQSFAP
jgi:hypothetical protein